MSLEALDIEHLRYLLDEAGSYDELSDQAIEIKKRLDEGEVNARWFNHAERLKRLLAQRKEFEELLALIRDRRGKRALAKYDHHCSTQPGTLYLPF